MQNLHNLLYREEEREMNPFCNAEGIGLIPWSPLARGLLCRPWNTTTERSVKDARTKLWFNSEQDQGIVEKVEEIAEKKGVSMTAVATAWLLSKGECPIIGLGSVERIESVGEAFEVELSNDEVKDLESGYRPLAVTGI